MGWQHSINQNQNLPSTMISPDAKCVVNGEKLNEAIEALNGLLNMSIMVGTSETPQVKISSSSAQIVLPPSGGADTNEQLDIVDADNTVAQRFFLTTEEAGNAGGGGAGVNDAAPMNQAQGAPANKKRNQLNAGGAQGAGGGGAGAAGADRDKLQNRGAGAGSASGNAGAGRSAGSSGNSGAGRSAGSSGSSGSSGSAGSSRSAGAGGSAGAGRSADSSGASSPSTYAGKSTGKTAGYQNEKFESKVDRLARERRQAAADDTAAANEAIWKYGSAGQKSKGTANYAKYSQKRKLGSQF